MALSEPGLLLDQRLRICSFRVKANTTDEFKLKTQEGPSHYNKMLILILTLMVILMLIQVLMLILIHIQILKQMPMRVATHTDTEAEINRNIN